MNSNEQPLRSAELHSAVSRICNPQAVRKFKRLEMFARLPNAIRRYSRVQLCATSASDSRRAELRFSRATQYRGEVGAHPQDAKLKAPRAENVA